MTSTYDAALWPPKPCTEASSVKVATVAFVSFGTMANHIDSIDVGSDTHMLDTDQPEVPSTNGTRNGPILKPLPTFWQSITQRVGLTSLSQGGWRTGVRCAAALSAFVLLVNISVVAVAYTNPLRRQSGESFGPLIIGNCERIKRIGTWIHLGINVLSSLVLGGSNYCLQCLSAPTRTEVDKAHLAGFWLHIGVPNIHNFRKTGHRKFWISVILGLSSIPFHLLYNSAFYTSTTTYSYNIYFANEGFATGAYIDEDLFSNTYRNVTVRLPNGTISEMERGGFYWTDVHEIRNLAMEGENGPFERLEKDECIRKYANPLLTDRRNLILVASNSPLDNLTFIGDFSDVDASDNPLCPAHPPQPAVCGPQKSQAIMTGSLNFVTCSNSSLYAVTSWLRPYVGNWGSHYFQWICSQNGSAFAFYSSVSCVESSSCTAEAAWERYHGAQQWIVAGFDIDHCLSETMEGECALNIGLPLLLTVIVFNVVKLLAIIATIWTIKEKPLVTIGDAIASFIERCDMATSGMCLWSWKEIAYRRNPRGHGASCDSRHADSSTSVMEMLTTSSRNSNLTLCTPAKSPSAFLVVGQRRYMAASNRRWVLTGFLLATAFLAIIVLFSYAMFDLGKRGNVPSIWKIWIGAILPETLIHGWNVANNNSSVAIVQTVLIANLPQFLLTFLYFILNSLFTSMSLATEWSHYGQHRRGLRVSHRRSQDQRTTYFLQLPYRLSIPLLCLSVLLHWMVSQTIFYVQIIGKDAVGDWWNAGEWGNYRDLITCGYSPLGMIIILVVLVVLMGFAIALGFRRLAPGIPIAGSCSMAIAAACHVPEGTSELLPVKWGVVSEDLIGDGEIIGHCSFSNDRVDSPVAERLYA